MSPSDVGGRYLSFFRDMKIQTKLTLGFGLQLALVAVVAAGGLFGLHHVQQGYGSALTHGLEVERLAGEIRIELLEARRAEKDFLLARHADGFATANAKHVANNRMHVNRIHAAILELEKLPVKKMEFSADLRIQDDLVELKPYVYVYAQDFQAAVDWFGKTGSQASGGDVRIQDSIFAKIAEIQTAASIVEPLAADIAVSGKKTAEAEIADARSSTRRSVLMMCVGVMAAISTGFGLAYALGRQIKKPLEALAATAEAVGAGDLNSQAQVGSNDEIGTLAAGFNAMTGRIRELVDSLEHRVAETRSAEEALRSSQQLLQNLIDNSTAVIFVKDLEGRYLLVNRRYEEIFHVTNQSILGKTDYDLFSREAADVFRANDRRAVSEGRPLESEESVLHDDGMHTYISIKCPLRLESGVVYAVCGISTDITERILMEEKLRQSQKMEAVGQLAGGIAHDFNNLLTAINGYSEMAMLGLESSHPLYVSISQILKSGKRAEGLTRQLLAYSRKQILEPKIWQLNAIVSDLETMLRRVIGEDIHLVTSLSSELGMVKLDRGQVEQILVNLVLNARDAMPDGGEVKVETANAYLDLGFASTHLDIVPGPHVMVVVSDTGTGMTDAIKAKIFEPFFTTKEPGKGTGLGLSSVYGIVKQSGGAISVHSEYGKGTTFRLYFPEVPAEGQPASEVHEKPDPKSYRGKETILLVEDEDLVRTFACQVLEMQGYSVIQAKDGRIGLQMLQETAQPVHLVITDVVMPNMGGYDLVAGIHRILPELPFLFITGYTENSDGYRAILDEGGDFLQKPFSPIGLSRKVREIMDRTSLVRSGGNPAKQSKQGQQG